MCRHKRDGARKAREENDGIKKSVLHVTHCKFDRAVTPEFLPNPEQINKPIKELKEAPAQHFHLGKIHVKKF